MIRMTMCAAAVLAASSAMWAQTTAGPPAFEVASVKPSEMPVGQMRISMARSNEPGGIHYTMMSLRDLVRVAYDVKDYQISGPEWMITARFDVTATYPPEIPKDQVPLMMQSLLAERFGLVVHREK